MLSARSSYGVFKPEYFFRPQQIIRKFCRELSGRKREMKVADLPWGLKLNVDTGESIGWSIYTRALYETPIVEALWRLTQPGDLVVDGGANIGYMTSVLAIRVGKSGRVLSFEPHPEIFSQLKRNVALWSRGGVAERVELFQTALGDTEGFACLRTPTFFSTNTGTSWVEHNASDSNAETTKVPVTTLDRVIPNGQTVGVVKLDVEGFELSVLKGMKNLLASRKVRYLIFEEANSFPAPTHKFLSGLGYFLYGIEHSFGGIHFLRDQEPASDPISGPPQNYLATLEPPDVMSRVAFGLWRSFGPLSNPRETL